MKRAAEAALPCRFGRLCLCRFGSGTKCGTAQHVVDDAGYAHAEEPAIDVPPIGKPVGKVRQDGREQRSDECRNEGVDVPAILEAELAVFLVEAGDIQLTLPDQVVIHHHDAEESSNCCAYCSHKGGSNTYPRGDT